MKELIDFKNDVAREAGHVDWEMLVGWKRSYGDYPAKEHDEAVERYINHRIENANLSLEDAVKAHRIRRRF